jgi:arginyl-tRNA synthetase
MDGNPILKAVGLMIEKDEKREKKMKIETILAGKVAEGLKHLFDIDVSRSEIIFQKTRKEFEGDLTLVVFPYTKASKLSPEATGEKIGLYLKENCNEVAAFNTVKGFLNLVISDKFWFDFFQTVKQHSNLGLQAPEQPKTIMVEYSSPNTNKPLHLGHIRNNLLGYAVAEILKAYGHKVIKSNLVNDRGIHICKSMLAWQKWGNGETPQSSGLKGDHLVGKYYVEFDKHYKQEINELVEKTVTKEEAEKKAPLIIEAQELLRKWEKGDKETVNLWKKMNSWVYEGFEKTYKTLGVDFDRFYYESETYLLGKKLVDEGLQKGVFYQKEDGSVWIDLTDDGLDHKLLLRSDGTSVYITQDMGTAVERFREFTNLDQLIYTVGNEQDYHFKVLFLILKKLGYKQAEECYHLSYGMVELPEGKMKSREGTVVDADDLLKEMFDTARETTQQLGKIEGFSNEEAEKLYYNIGSGALKYFILKVDPKKKMLFNPAESIDFNGNTGPFIQYTYARIQSILRKAGNFPSDALSVPALHQREKEVIKLIYDFPLVIKEAASNYSPAVVANYVYELAKIYNQFYHDVTVLKEEQETLRNFRLQLSELTGKVINFSMKLLGIDVPERM